MFHLSENEGIKELKEEQFIVVIHPGSYHLRIGRPSDSAPYTILHAVAYKKKSSYGYSDSFLTPPIKLDRQTSKKIEECRLKVSHILQSCFTSDGGRRFATPPQQVSAFNKRCQPVIDEWSPLSPSLLSPKNDVVIGNDILNTQLIPDYSIHFPFQNGDLNLHSKSGGSVFAVLSQLETIWRYCIENILKIPIHELKQYRAVLIIPDIYDRQNLKKLASLLFCDLGFGSCFFIQDHVAASFGAGLGSACVVDVGARKTSVSCVEDAISFPSTRIRVNYGGDDITQVLEWLLKKTGFPVPFDMSTFLDVKLLNELKINNCHIDLDVCGSQEKDIIAIRPGDYSLKYKVQIGDELIIAPLSIFYTDLLLVTGPKFLVTQKPNQGDPEDLFDENFLRDTARLRGRETAENLDPNEGMDDDLAGDESLTSERFPVVSSSIGALPLYAEKAISVDQAILASIEKCANEETKRRMYSTILIVGGGAKFSGFGKWLQNRLSSQIPIAYRAEQMEVITKPKDLDPTMTTWKGASLLTCLEGSSELWISKGEWVKNGVKILREKSPFIW